MPSDGDNENILIVCRIRPLSQAEKDRGDQDIVKVSGEGVVCVRFACLAF